MDLQLRDRVCLVTGSTAGIGLETARILAQEGATVAVSGRDGVRVEAARADAGAALGIVCDLSSPDGPASLVAEVEDALDRVDCLVNNVGFAVQRSFEEVTEDDWESMWQLNVMSYVRTIRAAAPGMRQRGEAGSSTSARRRASAPPRGCRTTR